MEPSSSPYSDLVFETLRPTIVQGREKIKMWQGSAQLPSFPTGSFALAYQTFFCPTPIRYPFEQMFMPNPMYCIPLPVAAILWHLRFKSVTHVFGEVGHTHNQVDQRMGVAAAQFSASDTIQCPEARCIKPSKVLPIC